MADFMDGDDDDDGLDDGLDNCQLVGPNNDGFGCPFVDTDKDGLPDASDPCPHNPNRSCVSVISGSNTVVVAGRTWAQPVIFAGISYGLIKAVCPNGPCAVDGVINGFDVAGWTWASVSEVSGLLPVQEVSACRVFFQVFRATLSIIENEQFYVLGFIRAATFGQVESIGLFPNRVDEGGPSEFECRADFFLSGETNSIGVWIYKGVPGGGV